MRLLSLDPSSRGVIRSLSVLVAFALAANAPHTAGGDTAGAQDAPRDPVIVSLTAPGAGNPNLPTRTIIDLAENRFGVATGVQGCRLLPRTVLLRSGATPSAAPWGCLLVTQWSTASF